MRFGMMGMATIIMATTAGMAHGERESGKPWSVPNYSTSGDEIMFVMDMPYVPAQDSPVVLAQAVTPSDGNRTQRPDYLLKLCGDMPSVGAQNTAENGVDPAGWLAGYLDSRDNRFIEAGTVATIKLTMLQGTSHGKLIRHTTEAGLEYYMYEAEQGYKGKDKAVFLAEFEGKAYKIVIDLNVYPVEAIADNMPSTCPPPKLIKLNKPLSETSPGLLNSFTVALGDLSGSTLGQTIGSSITLDTNAAGYGWYIDYTPYLNEDKWGQTTVSRVSEAYRRG